MTWDEVIALFGPGPIAGALAYLILSALMIAIRLRPAAWNRRITRAMDRILQRESERLSRGDTLLGFPPADQCSAGAGGLGWWFFPGRVEIMRTVRAALQDGYRIKLRARARGARGRVLVRSLEFDLRRSH